VLTQEIIVRDRKVVFVWQVAAVDQGTDRKSEAAQSRFTVEIEEVGASRGQESGVLFGKE
jgi:hypothetical protein